MYVDCVRSEPSNAASDRARRDLPQWRDLEFIATQGRAALDDDFVHEDRRPLVALPTMGPDEYVSQALGVFEVYDYNMWVDSIVAVRGERLVLFIRSIAQDDWEPVQSFAIAQYDADINLVERWIRFDIEQREEALTALDELHRSLEA